MFNRKKKAENDKKKSKENNVDKIIMGVIIGGAIGSVLGVSMAPKKGKETREIITNKAKEAINNVKKKEKKSIIGWLFETPSKSEKKDGKQIPFEK